jgi:hypothetical protein
MENAVGNALCIFVSNYIEGQDHVLINKEK